MSASNYLLCFIASMLGMGVYLFVVKIPAIQDHAKAANHPMTLGQYFQTDMNALVGSILSILLMLLWADEVVKLYPKVMPVLKIMYGTIGFMNSTLVIAWLGKASKIINEVVDIKTDIADGKRPATDNPTAVTP